MQAAELKILNFILRVYTTLMAVEGRCRFEWWWW